MINFYNYYTHNELNSQSDYADGLVSIRAMNTSNDYSNVIHIIKRDPYYASIYAIHLLKCRWPEAEPSIMKNAFCAHSYALRIIRGRWLEAESTIMQTPRVAYYYAKQVIQGRWKEAELHISKSERWWSTYTAFLEDLRAGNIVFNPVGIKGISLALPAQSDN